MTIRNNEAFSIQLVPNQLSPLQNIPGSLTGDTLNVVSPCYSGPAFVPRNLTSRQTVIDTVGSERNNLYGHLYDQLHYYVPNQGIDCLNIWFDNEGANAVHTRILGIGETAGFKLSATQDINFIFSSFTSDSIKDENYISELGITDDDPMFLSHLIFIPENVTSELIEGINVTSELIEGIRADLCNIRFSNSGQAISKLSDNLFNSLNNKKPINSRDEEYDNLFSTEFNNELHYIYTKFCQYPTNSNLSILKKDTSDSTEEINEIDYKNFQSEYSTAKTPWVTSQPYDRSDLTDNRENIQNYVTNLFRFWSLDDGEVGNRFKIKINLKKRGDHTSSILNYSIFDVYFFEYDARINQFKLLEIYEDVNLDSDDSNYIGRRIGTLNRYYDKTTKKIYEEGIYENVSRYLRVEINDKIETKKVTNIQSIIPSGFRAYPHINVEPLRDDVNNNLYATPVLYYQKYNNVSEIDGIINTWGTQMYKVLNNGVANPSITIYDNIIMQDQYHDYISPHYFHTKYFNESVWKEDDNYLNNFFHLEKICYKNNITFGLYKDSGKHDSLPEDYVYLDLDKIDFQKFIYKLSFDFFTYGGFDGTDILNFDKKYMTNKGLMEEYYDKEESCILNNYKTGIDQITKYENCNGTILTVPDVSTNLIHEYCIEKSEALTRYFYIGDIKDYEIDITNTTDNIKISDYYQIEKTFANYEEDEIETLPYNLEETKEKMIQFVNNNIFSAIDSQNYFPVFGDHFVTITNDFSIISKYISPVTFVTGIIANFRTLKRNIVGLTPLFNSALGSVSEFLFNDALNLRLNNDYSSIETETIKNIFFRKNINCFTLNGGLTNDAPGLLLAHNYSGESFNFNRKFNINRIIKLIKNEIMINLYTDTSVIPETVLFNTTSQLGNIYQKIKIQLTLLMERFKTEGYITGYKVNIDQLYNNNFNDILNNKLKGNIIIQFGESNIIDLDLDNVLSELNESLSSDDNKVYLPRVI